MIPAYAMGVPGFSSNFNYDECKGNYHAVGCEHYPDVPTFGECLFCGDWRTTTLFLMGDGEDYATCAKHRYKDQWDTKRAIAERRKRSDELEGKAPSGEGLGPIPENFPSNRCRLCWGRLLPSGDCEGHC